MTSTKKKYAAIAIDKWKLATFTKHLTAGGYAFEKLPGVTSDTWLLKVPVEPEGVEALTAVVAAANAESRAS